MASSTAANGAKPRLYLFTFLLCLWAVAICGRLIYLQVIEYGDFVQRAARQQQRTVDVEPRRGIIYDRNGQELAMSVMVVDDAASRLYVDGALLLSCRTLHEVAILNNL